MHIVTMSEGTIATSLEIKLRAQSGVESCRAHVCCSVLQCVTVCCSVSRCANMCKHVCCSVKICVLCCAPRAALWAIEHMCVAECCSVLQCVAVCQ